MTYEQEIEQAVANAQIDVRLGSPDPEQTTLEWASNFVTALAVHGFHVVRLPREVDERICVFCEQPFDACEKDPECGYMDSENK